MVRILPTQKETFKHRTRNTIAILREVDQVFYWYKEKDITLAWRDGSQEELSEEDGT